MAAMSDRQWVDANLMIRFLTRDSPELSPRSRALFERAERGEVTLRVPAIIVAEVVWVLASFYRWTREDIATRFSGFLRSEGLEVEESPLVLAALHLMSSANVSFVDAYLAESARRAGEPLVSFDRNFSRLNVEWIEPELDVPAT